MDVVYLITAYLVAGFITALLLLLEIFLYPDPNIPEWKLLGITIIAWPLVWWWYLRA